LNGQATTAEIGIESFPSSSFIIITVQAAANCNAFRSHKAYLPSRFMTLVFFKPLNFVVANEEGERSRQKSASA
jgi:hypothetical protein